MAAIVEVIDLCYEYPGKRALDSVNFTLEAGTITALVGPNGAGKTTMLRCMAALDDPYTGTIKINGIDTQDDPRQCHEYLGYLADSFGLYEELTVEQCLRHTASIHSFNTQDEARVVDEAIQDLWLESYRNTKAGVLSRGERQRVGIAQAVLHRPKILLLDEPASGLDPESRKNLSKLFLRLRDKGVSIVVSSHILTELEDYSDGMLTLNAGRIVGHTLIHAKDKNRIRKIAIEINDDLATAFQVLGNIADVSCVEIQLNKLYFDYGGDRSGQAALLRHLIECGVEVVSLTELESSMQEVYLKQMQGVGLITNDQSGNS